MTLPFLAAEASREQHGAEGQDQKQAQQLSEFAMIGEIHGVNLTFVSFLDLIIAGKGVRCQ